ncbi:methylmalonyl-CoA epimerase [bacterium]|nr:methylmalonyl-CoA epimerase [bacterium]
MDNFIKKVDHVAFAVSNLERSYHFYKDIFQMEFMGYETVESQKIKTAIFIQNGVKIELLEPTSPESPIAKYIEKKGEGIHHICYEVFDIEAAVLYYKEMGANFINEKPTDGIHNTKIVFLHPKNCGHLIELNQKMAIE